MKKHHDILQALPFYQGLSAAGQQLLAQGAKYASADASQIILRQGQKASGAYMVLAGRLRVYSVHANGSEATLYTIERGETCVLALNCLFNHLLYPAWVEAETDTQVIVIPGQLYRQLFSQEAAVQDLTVRTLSTVVFRLMDELEQVHSLNNRQRLANLLLVRASEQGQLEMTQQQIAQHLGTRREVIARLLSEFAEKGYLQTGRGRLTLLDTDSLRDIASARTQPE